MELNHVLLFTSRRDISVDSAPGFSTPNSGRPRPSGHRPDRVRSLLAVGPINCRLALCDHLVRAFDGASIPQASRPGCTLPASSKPEGDRHSIAVVLTLIIINIAVFILELLAGGSTNELTLHRLGELDTSSVIYRHEYWRLFAALFLHYGPIHIFFNLFALLLLGPPLERQIGGLLFFVCYAVSGLGSSIAVVLLTRLRLLDPVQLVGASGCIMGVVGTWAGFLLRHRHLLLARQRLRNIFVIVLLQLAFDVVTPRVSMSAHLGGLFTGFLLGLIVPARSRF
jgi:membrane associated rhomboid family serine protease